MQLAQIAHHNAQILRHIKGGAVIAGNVPPQLSSPIVSQYHNPFPVFPLQSSSGGGHHGGAGGGGTKHFIVQTSNVVQHPPSAKYVTAAAAANSNAERYNNLMASSSNVAQTIVPNLKSNYLSVKDLNAQIKYLNSIHTSTEKMPITPVLMKSMFSSTTSRIPIIRFV